MSARKIERPGKSALWAGQVYACRRSGVNAPGLAAEVPALTSEEHSWRCETRSGWLRLSVLGILIVNLLADEHLGKLAAHANAAAGYTLAAALVFGLVLAIKSPLAPVAATAMTAVILVAVPANAQDLATPSDWLDRLDREHNQMVSKGGHVHARGQIEAVDIGPGTVTILSEEMESPDKTIWMPAMRMVFHVTNRRMLQGLKRGDDVEFEAARLRNAVMITNIRKRH